ncbi:hypothetical protein Fmac_018481 [Flemingia macrophylla]|uniref:Uncharacterized protein n=1 Tax=Flemingia macrophylla TaxID=520843 RepID=A0ABD1M532_9FABA
MTVATTRILSSNYCIVWRSSDDLDVIDKLQSIFHRWENTANAGERSRLSKEVIAGCESIERQVYQL